ncbi:hypothetical protein F66182_7089 [Fusarium sp. NRRL 66182]|nr:hypothetical protein F66182_7089 [Fusarium sp. NRRL 66182]
MPPEPMTVPIISPALSLKPPVQSWDLMADMSKIVWLLHPGYPDGDNTLLTLPCLDSGGIHHETARIACAIYANCRWDGYLSSSKDGPALSAQPDDVLPFGQYYFIIKDEPQYPVVPSFEHFVCPADLPDAYSQASIARSKGDGCVTRDETCRITASSFTNETAHIIPDSQKGWWKRNRMSRYTSAPDKIHITRCPENTILMRRDLHKLWDDGEICIVPKQNKWVIHVLTNTPKIELRERYHNLELQSLSGIQKTYLLCRFAMVMFSKSHFLSGGTKRKLIYLKDLESGSNIHTTKEFTSKAIDEKFDKTPARSGSRNPSPKRPRDDTVDDEVCWEESDYSQEYDSEQEEEEERRGRSLKRRWSPDTWDEISPPKYQKTTNLTKRSGENVSPFRKHLRSSSPKTKTAERPLTLTPDSIEFSKGLI